MREGRRSSARIRRRGLLVRRTTASARVRVGAVFLGHCDKLIRTLEAAGRPLRHLAPELRLADGIRRSARSTEEAPSACYEVCDGFFWGLRCGLTAASEGLRPVLGRIALKWDYGAGVRESRLAEPRGRSASPKFVS